MTFDHPLPSAPLARQDSILARGLNSECVICLDRQVLSNIHIIQTTFKCNVISLLISLSLSTMIFYELKGFNDSVYVLISVHVYLGPPLPVWIVFQSAVIFLSCGHVCCCEECSAPLKDCPLCRGAIVQRIKLNSAVGQPTEPPSGAPLPEPTEHPPPTPLES